MAKPKQPDYHTILNIRKLHQTGEFTQAQLAEMFDLAQSTISKIVNNETHEGIYPMRIGGEALVRVGYRYGN